MAWSLVIAFAIEFLQLYQAPWMQALRANKLAYLVLGNGFDPLDLLAYVVGIALGAAADWACAWIGGAGNRSVGIFASRKNTPCRLPAWGVVHSANAGAVVGYLCLTRYTTPLPSSLTNSAPSGVPTTPVGRPQVWSLSTMKPVMKSMYSPVGLPFFITARTTL